MTHTPSRRATLVGGALVAVCGLSGCLSGSRDVERTVTESHATDAVTGVAVETEHGDVEVVPTDDGEIDVTGQKAALTRDDLETIGLETMLEDGVLVVAVDRDDSRTLFGLRPPPVVDLAVSVPDGLPLERVRTVAGAVDVTGVEGDVSATAEAGDVTLRDVGGTVSATTDTGALTVLEPESIDRLETQTGDVTASLPGLDGDATIETTTGAVDLRLPDQLDLSLEMTTETGTLSVTDVDDLPELAGDSLIEADVGDGTHRLEITTETGDVRVSGRD
ncbi:DUF4097 family beta strand repeat-containing protein [Natronolimnohabitans innermongolicus]|uniref:DUF4097 domain-containing protein n=1 Tax=Natronolimnohabitans innermongolicus JCM 12255 TaxID=1227499 RepID=L9WHU3_9EURY|nr:DUF4097 family beta strand repeat-containing protein [Natronolimnohabitans innermongolicus]ELY48816.1 hypothetical protein C493_21576 [Natronolimnohabitans innermongolicus JCM 12255]